MRRTLAMHLRTDSSVHWMSLRLEVISVGITEKGSAAAAMGKERKGRAKCVLCVHTKFLSCLADRVGAALRQRKRAIISNCDL